MGHFLHLSLSLRTYICAPAVKFKMVINQSFKHQVGNSNTHTQHYSSSMSTVSRRTKWHPTPPPPPSPKILHLPRRRRTHRRKQTKPQNNPLLLMNQRYDLSYKGSLESLLYQEPHGVPLELLNSSVERRERVEEREDDEEEEGCGGFAEEKWRFQAEMLRAECNLLRMEREFALKKLEKNRVKMETTLRSAVQTLQSVSLFSSSSSILLP